MSLKINFYCREKYNGMVPEPIPSNKKFPKWFSDLPLNSKKFKYEILDDNPRTLINSNSDNNVKKCLGIQDILKTGYIIPAWADFIFREEENGSLFINWMENYFNDTKYDSHGVKQFSTMPNKPIYGHFGKIFTPWIITTDPGVSCLVTDPVWHRNKSFTSATAIVHTDNVPLNLAWFFEWNYKIKSKMNIDEIEIDKQVVSKGEPLIHIIPFYRKNFSSKINYVNEEKWESLKFSAVAKSSDSMGGQCPYKNFRKNLGNLFL